MINQKLTAKKALPMTWKIGSSRSGGEQSAIDGAAYLADFISAIEASEITVGSVSRVGVPQKI